MQHKLLINGELVSGEGEKQPVYNPATGDVLLEIAEASAEQVNAAVRAADAAFAEWGQTTPKARAECLLKLADVIEENGQVFAELESRNCGKPLHSAFNDEIPAIVDVFRFFAGAARCLNGLAAGEYPSRSVGGRGFYRTVELSADDGCVETGSGAGGRELRSA